MSTNAYAEDILGKDVESSEERSEERSEEVTKSFHGRPPHPQKRRSFKTPHIGQDFVTLTEKIILPVNDYPKYNFVGKLLGPKGSNLKNMQSFSKVKMSIMGRGSSKDRSKEEELCESGDPQYEHLKEPLHVVISAKSTRMEAHRRLASACRELNKFMGPVNEEMSQLQQPETVIESQPPVNNGREVALPMAPAPKIMFGVPPPGAIILNENPSIGQARIPRSDERAERAAPVETYAYSGYPETSNRGNTFRHAEKRNAPDPGFPLKRYKQEPYGKTQYTSR